MAKKEAKTDLWVYGLLKEAGIDLEPQGSSIIEINEALKSASKSGSGNVGFPEYVGVVDGFLIVIENKADLTNHKKQCKDGLISLDPKEVKKYAKQREIEILLRIRFLPTQPGSHHAGSDAR